MTTPKGVPLIDLAAQHRPLRSQLRAAFERVLQAEHYILGEEVDAFERELSLALGIPHVIGVSSGSDALLLALMALGIGPGDEVITTPYSFFATAGAIGRVGACPVFVDIDPETFNLDLSRIEAAVNTRTRAVLPVHLFGRACDLKRLRALCDRHDLFLIEDAAQAIDADSGGLKVGSVGEFGCFSLFPAKNLGALGDAGFVTTTRADLAERARTLRVHGAKQKYQHVLLGGNFRLDALQAALLRAKLPLLPSLTARRRANAARYDDLLLAAVQTGRVCVPQRVPGHVYNQYTLRVVDGRDALQAHLRADGIESAIYYPTALHMQPCFSALDHPRGAFPHAERACETALSIPIYPELPPESLERVAASITAWAQAMG